LQQPWWPQLGISQAFATALVAAIRDFARICNSPGGRN
jgi:hypothetical protein